MKVVVVAGEPGTGKSTLMKNLIGDAPSDYKSGLVRGHSVGSVLFLGIYDADQKYPGTDRLSMAVQPDVQKLLWSHATSPYKTVVFEGDRLSNPSLIKFIENLGLELHAFVLEVSQEVLDQRRAARGDTFSEKWLKGRKTKVHNFRNASDKFRVLRNETGDDLQKNLELLSRVVFCDARG